MISFAIAVAATRAVRRTGLALSLFLAATPAGTVAQVRASERGTVSQTVDGTVIDVDYGRPRLRGRTAFGGIVHWGEMWTPGANFATTLSVSKAVKVNDHPLPAGRYSVWVAPGEQQWTLYLHRNAKLYHLQRPKPAEMLLAISVAPTKAPAIELLTFDFPEVRRDGATLRLRWDESAISLAVDVPPTAPARRRLTAHEVAAYLGEYQAWIFAESGDSTGMRQRLVYEDGRLQGIINEGPHRFDLVPAGGPHRFWFENRDDDGPVDVELARPVEFTVGPSRRATGFRMRGIEQPLWMRGVRTSP